MKRDFYIYLAGFIQGSKLKECVEWRKKVREHYDHWKDEEPYPIVWLDPLNGKDLATITDNGLKSSCPPHAIVHRDYKCVEKSDLIVANMDTFGEDRGLCGTICELAWAWQMKKPIILITNEIKYKEHPFIKYFSSWIVESVDEMLEKKAINYFYKGTHSAQY